MGASTDDRAGAIGYSPGGAVEYNKTLFCGPTARPRSCAGRGCRSHPSVIISSIGNEIPEAGSEHGGA
jgi:hypothetical protein